MLTWQLATSANKLFSYVAHVNQRRSAAKWGPFRGGGRPLCIASVIMMWVPCRKELRGPSVFSGCHPTAPKVADSAPTGVNLGSVGCFDVCGRCFCCLPGLHPTRFLILFTHFDKLCEFFLFTDWLLKSLDVSARGGALFHLSLDTFCRYLCKEYATVHPKKSFKFVKGSLIRKLKADAQVVWLCEGSVL